MAGCAPFTVGFSADPELLFTKAISKADGTGAEVRGDAQSGEVVYRIPVFGRICVAYDFDGQKVTLRCKDRPMLVSCAMIEQTVREELARADQKLAARSV